MSNTYAGTTTVSTGTLRINGGSLASGSAVTVSAGASNYAGGRLGGNGTVSGTVSLTGNATAKLGGVIAAGADDSTIGTLTTGNETWNGGSVYDWKIKTAGTNASFGTGNSATGSWDSLKMSGLSLSNAGASNAPITISLDSLSPSPSGSGTYSWVIGNSTTAVSGFSSTYAGTAYRGQNLLTHTLDGASSGTGVSAAFALDTSGFGTGGFTLNSANSNNFSLEFISNGASGDYLVLDYNTAPEPGTAMLVLGGALPMLMRRRRRTAVANTN